MKPLEGVKILDFSRYIAGPLSTMYLAEFGAEVIKVESPGKGDDSRTWEPLKNGVSGYFSSFNRSKKSITLNLKNEQHKEVIYKIIEKYDVVVCNFSPGVSKRLGIDYDQLKKYNPKIIYCDISGFGQEGPNKNRKGFDTIFQAMGGIMSLTGSGDGTPVKAGIPIGDYSGALYATISILLSLFKKERNQEGEYIDLSLYDSVINLLPLALAFYDFKEKIIEPKGTQHPGRVPSSAFETKEGGYVQISVTDNQWFQFCEAIGLDDETANNKKFNLNKNRLKNRSEIMAIIQSAIIKHTKNEVVEKCNETGIPCGPVNNLEDILEDQQVSFRQLIGSYNITDQSEPINYIKFPSKFKNSTIGMTSKPPLLGEHSLEVLKKELGLNDQHIKEILPDKNCIE